MQITGRGGSIRLAHADFSPHNLEENGLVYRVLNKAIGVIETGALRPTVISLIRIEGSVRLAWRELRISALREVASVIESDGHHRRLRPAAASDKERVG